MVGIRALPIESMKRFTFQFEEAGGQAILKKWSISSSSNVTHSLVTTDQAQNDNTCSRFTRPCIIQLTGCWSFPEWLAMLIFWPRWKPSACIIAVPPNHPTLDSGESAAAGGGRAGPKPVPISTFSSSSSSSWCACTCCQTGWSTPGPDRPPLEAWC